MRFLLRTTAFGPGGRIPARHTADGANLSPPLAWEGAPTVTGSFALVCHDPDAPGGDWVHWIAWNIPAEHDTLPEGVPPEAHVPDVAEQGLNDFGRVGWGGPAPPLGQDHRYVFELYALESRLTLPPRATRAQLAAEMEGRVLAHATITGHYGRGVASASESGASPRR
jgi:hypothetical protein